MPVRGEATPLRAVLIERIRSEGPITFAEYMDACLYDPRYGYYSAPDQQARRDYFTNADVRPVFARLLARQFDEMWSALGRPDPFFLIEAGAGTGAFARDVLDFLCDRFPELYGVVRYVAVERSAARRTGQAQRLVRHLEGGRFASASEMPERIPEGCIVSNELIDALPVHRVVELRSGCRELYVGLAGDDFREETGRPSSTRIAEYFTQQGIILRPGQQAEAGLAACDWIQQAGARLGRGFVLTIDYGRPAGELYDERHMRGTLLAYERHRASEDFYRAPGRQDLTAHANFTALDLWGRRSGLLPGALVTQSNFLLALARRSNFADIESAGESETRKARGRLLFKTLVYPEGMGEAFQVMVQHKGIPWAPLGGLEPI
ncbi:MAG TPA: SAM-dependent methyltransferase [Candidatus Cybelea sp.]|nr:SAM-dependent methyltransferase [Candidatus Cybelea sp.]